jgi:hypothetical protein
MKSSQFLAVILIAVCLIGCGKSKQSAASVANGYVCTKCQLKFYTDDDVNVELCPACKSYISPVVGYVCADKHLTVGSRSQRRCETCQQPVSDTRAPTIAELQAWGAVKKTKQEVTQK